MRPKHCQGGQWQVGNCRSLHRHQQRLELHYIIAWGATYILYDFIYQGMRFATVMAACLVRRNRRRGEKSFWRTFGSSVCAWHAEKDGPLGRTCPSTCLRYWLSRGSEVCIDNSKAGFLGYDPLVSVIVEGELCIFIKILILWKGSRVSVKGVEGRDRCVCRYYGWVPGKHHEDSKAGVGSGIKCKNVTVAV